MSIKVMAMSDTHCGSDVGLTPPEWDKGPKANPEAYARRRAMWNWFEESRPRKVDVVLFNGDAIDGKGKASDGSELLYADWDDQVNMSIEIIKSLGAKEVVMSYGTAYHTGKDKDFEDDIAQRLGATISSVPQVTIGNTTFDMRHHLGRSSILKGRLNAVLGEVDVAREWARRGEYPLADVLIRSHVHYFGAALVRDILAMTLPSLQAYGTKYGSRRVSGTVDVGFVTFNVKGPEPMDFDWDVNLWTAPFQKPQVIK
ncbi:hypothetical protein LCGC14_2869940 [marine sediment metagenome]|uniref:Calcineurin-like phosphoesterase domain-containing protein n=1 Tax=marine sediment metagenome TaxID=412755 RepID=A0A0F8YPX6_9ZZZZ